MGTVELRSDFVFFYASRQNFRRKYFGVVLGTIAEEFDVRVVPTAAQIIGDAVYDYEVIIWVVDATARKLHHVAVADPYQQLPGVHRPVNRAKGTDAKAGDAQTVLIGIEPAESLSEYF